MKKTLTVNLGGTIFNIDEDAYRLLDKYLSNLKYHFKKEEGADEIVKDIELRISELFMERTGAGYQIISIEYVEEVIERVGKPEDLADADGQEKQESGQRIYHEKISRKLYRDSDNKILGGVAGGFATYLGWDATLVRIIMLLILILPFFHFPIVVIYVICWLLIPLAQTASEKLAMKGERVTVENIGRTVTDGFEKMSDDVNDYIKSGKSRSALQKVGDALVQVVGICIKAILLILAIVFSPVLFILAVLFVVFITVAVSFTLGGGAYLYHWFPADISTFGLTPMLGILFSIFGILLIGIPLVAIVYAVLCHLFSSWKPMSLGMKWTLFALWFISLIICIVLGIQNINLFHPACLMI